MFIDAEHLERSRLAFYITTIYFCVLGANRRSGAMLCRRLQSQYLADSSAESRHDHRRGGAEQDGVVRMKGIGHLQPEI